MVQVLAQWTSMVQVSVQWTFTFGFFWSQRGPPVGIPKVLPWLYFGQIELSSSIFIGYFWFSFA
jgi:hypothetical protein